MMESDDEHDAYLQKVKAEGRERYVDSDGDDSDSDGKNSLNNPRNFNCYGKKDLFVKVASVLFKKLSAINSHRL